jgi:hypothetical protein
MDDTPATKKGPTEDRPNETDPTTRTPNMAAQHLRASIDRGETGDKVPAADPAASPLGTDDEAAGMRPPPSVAPDQPVPENQRIPPGQQKGGNTFES